jgi:hypothetical protein
MCSFDDWSGAGAFLTKMAFIKSAYQKKLDDPRWQKKRLEILERAEWKCELCGSDSEQLQIHHRYYVANRDPWNYPDWSLRCCCHSCHKNSQAFESKVMGDFEEFFMLAGEAENLRVMVVDLVVNTNFSPSEVRYAIAQCFSKIIRKHIHEKEPSHPI